MFFFPKLFSSFTYVSGVCYIHAQVMLPTPVYRNYTRIFVFLFGPQKLRNKTSEIPTNRSYTHHCIWTKRKRLFYRGRERVFVSARAVCWKRSCGTPPPPQPPIQPICIHRCIRYIPRQFFPPCGHRLEFWQPKNRIIL